MSIIISKSIQSIIIFKICEWFIYNKLNISLNIYYQNIILINVSVHNNFDKNDKKCKKIVDNDGAFGVLITITPHKSLTA